MAINLLARLNMAPAKFTLAIERARVCLSEHEDSEWHRHVWWLGGRIQIPRALIPETKNTSDQSPSQLRSAAGL
jgi:hypothetical protein